MIQRLGALGVVVTLATLALGSRADAQAQVEVVPVFSEGCVPRTGPTEYVVGIANPTATPLGGTVQIDSTLGAYTPGVRTLRAVPFTVGAHGHATVRIATPPQGVATETLVLTVLDAQRHGVAWRPLHVDTAITSILLDATPQGRLAFALRAANPNPQAPGSVPVFGSASPLASLQFTSTPCPALRVPATGEIVLPRTRAGYNGVALVVADAATVIGLPPAERTALADYILLGGSMVVIPSRTDELRHPTLEAFLGRGIAPSSPPRLDPNAGEWLATLPSGTPLSFPAAPTIEHLEGFRGGNLHTRVLAPLFPWGAPDYLGGTADYGFGQVHVLSINPTAAPGLDDPWAVGIITRLAERALSQPVAAAGTVDAIPNAVRRALDPNEGFRPGLGFAVLALVLYAILAGPVSFRLAARRKRALRGLIVLPIASAVVFGGIVAMGSISRGFQGRARRIAVAELHAGMARGPVRRVRGFYQGEGGGLTVSAPGTDRTLFVDPGAGSGYVTLSLERDASVLRGLAITPWTTLVVGEEAIEERGGSVTVQPDALGQLRVVNHLPYALRQVVLIAPNAAQGWTFAEIPAGATRVALTGAPLRADLLAAFSTGAWADGGSDGTGTVTPHRGFLVSSVFGGSTDATRDWDAALAIAPNLGVAPAGSPVLIARAAMPAQATQDTGLRVDRDLLFLRIVGWGGAP